MIARVALFAMLLFAQTPQSPTRDARSLDVAPSGTASIAGVVVDHEQKPIRRATVTITGTSFLRSGVTDDAGRFAFAAVPPGRYAISARKGGYPQMNYGAKQPFRTGSGVVVAEGQMLSGLTLTLARGAVVEGTVYDERGEPRPGVPLNAWEVRTALSGERTFTFPRAGGVATYPTIGACFAFSAWPRASTRWARRGSSALRTRACRPTTRFARHSRRTRPRRPRADRPRGEAPRLQHRRHRRLCRPPRSFTLMRPNPMSARTFTLAAGEERTGVDLRMRMLPMSRIEAAVLEQDGSPAERVEVSTIRRSRVSALNSTTVSFVSGGRYRTEPLPQGDYGLVFTAPATADRPARSATMPVTISSAEPVKLTVTLQPQPPVTGRVVFEGAAPPPDKTRVRVLLRDAPGSFGNGNSVQSTVTADGVITISNVTPGRYFMLSSVPGQPTTGPTGWTLQSAQVDGRDVTDLPFEIAAGAPPSLTVTFIDKIGELSGRLVLPSGQPGTDYFVVIVPKEREYWLPGSRRIVSSRPDLTGRYLLRGLPAGNYQLAVTTELDTQDLSDVSALEKLVAASVTITLGVAEHKTFDIQLGGGGF